MNKPFKSEMAAYLEQYLSYRRGIGFTSGSLRTLLRAFDDYLKDHPTRVFDMTPAFFLSYKRNLSGCASTRNQKITAVRLFCDYLVRRELLSDNPVRDIPYDRENGFMPYILSPEETRRFIDRIAADIRREEAWYFKDLTVYTVIRMIAGCGLRISEPTRLTITDYRPDEGSIYIEKTKFNKDRLIPLPGEVKTELDNYLKVRRALLSVDGNPYLFPGNGDRKLGHKGIYDAFHKALDVLGDNMIREVIANMTFGHPTPHSLRHSFAVNTLKKIRDRGGSTQDALPILSAYMGHRKYRYTAVYLKYLDAEHRKNLVNFSIRHQEEI
jgi:integrase